MKIGMKWILACLCIFLLSACSTEENNNEIIEDISEDVSEDIDQKINENAELIEEAKAKKLEEDEAKVKDKELLLSKLKNDEWVEETSLYIGKDDAYVIYKKWLTYYL